MTRVLFITRARRANTCPERMEICSLGCSAKVKHSELYKHEQVALFMFISFYRDSE
jgi:hypothetical protein